MFARSYDLIHFRDALRAVRKSGNRLGPACLVHFVRSGFLRRYQCGGRHLPILPGGVTIMISSTPATLAGMMFMRTEEG